MDGLMPLHHRAWLDAHPERTSGWLKKIIADGFHIHHIDGDHDNNDPRNLVLIESGDHMMIHNGSARLLWKPRLAQRKKPKPSIEVRMARLQKQLDREERKKKRELKVKMVEIGKRNYQEYLTRQTALQQIG